MDNFNNQQPVAPQPVAPQPGNDAKTQSIVALVLGIVAAFLGVFG